MLRLESITSEAIQVVTEDGHRCKIYGALRSEKEKAYIKETIAKMYESQTSEVN